MIIWDLVQPLILALVLISTYAIDENKSFLGRMNYGWNTYRYLAENVLCEVLLPLVIVLYIRQRGLDYFGVPNFESILLSAIIGLILGLCISSLPLIFHMTLMEKRSIIVSHNILRKGWVPNIIFSSLSEEIFFRGTLQNDIAIILNAPTSIILVSIFFALLHHKSRKEFAVFFAISVFLGFAYYYFHDLVLITVTHLTMNMLVVYSLSRMGVLVIEKERG